MAAVDVCQQIEQALNEFFSASTDAARKQEIEKSLRSFQNDSNCLNIILSSLGRCQNQYALMFFLQTLQEVVDNKWIHLDPSTKYHIKECLRYLLMSFFDTQPRFLFLKLAKLYADIGQLEYVNLSTEYFPHMFHLLSSASTRLMALKFQQVTLEELSDIDNTLCCLFSQEKAAVREILNSQSPLILLSLDAIISDVEKEHSITGERYTRALYDTLLDCISATIQTLNIAYIVNDSILMGFLKSMALFAPSLKSLSETDVVLFEKALGCYIELTVSCTKVRADQYFEILDRMGILRLLITLSDLLGDERFGSKADFLELRCLKPFIELVRVFVAHQIHTAKKMHPEECGSLLEKFVNLSYNVTDVALFRQCIEVWAAYFDYLVSQNPDKKQMDTESSNDRLCSTLLKCLIAKLQIEHIEIHFNHPFEVDFGESQESDFQLYINAVCELLSKIAEFRVSSVFFALRNVFDQHFAFYMQFKSMASEISLNTSTLHLRNFQSILIAMSYVSHCFANDTLYAHTPKNECRDFVESLCRLIVYSEQELLDSSAIAQSSEISREIDNVLAKILLCLKSYCHWLANFYAEAQRSGDGNEIVSSIITAVTDAIIHLIVNRGLTAQPVILYASASTFYSVSLTVRPQIYFLSMKSVISLYEAACESKFHHFPLEVKKVLYGSLAGYLILPWYNAADCEQEWSHRKKLYIRLMRSLLGDYSKLCELDRCDPIYLRNFVENTLPVLVDLLDSIRNENAKTKKLAFCVFGAVGTETLRLLNLPSVDSNLVECLISLLSSLFSTLIVQFGADFVEQTMQFLLNITDRFAASMTLDASSHATRILGLVIQILSCVAKEMSRSMEKFTADIVNIAIVHIKPTVLRASCVELKESFLELLYNVLFTRWRYFFPVASSTKIEDYAADGVAAKAGLESETHLIKILETFGESLNDDQPSVLKIALHFLNTLNEKWNLYKRDIFVRRFYSDFARFLLSLLLYRSHPILTDDFYDSVSIMTCTQLETLHFFEVEFLPAYLTSLNKINSEQIDNLLRKFKWPEQSPSFALCLSKFVNDLSIFVRFNNNL